ncbi:unnamed protein product [Mytilus coruscus]|uniref:Uncharacterized protein n=1 Tax=Mytilus coruscus TaxID=42192 RepID=A0A6J8EFS8_MYTCO|nr:unnamed protein product [Mytilus coruscus]
MPGSMYTEYARFFVYRVCQVLCIQSMSGSMYTEYVRFYVYRVCQVLCIQSMSDSMYTEYARFFVYRVCQVLCIQSMPGSMYTEYARFFVYRVCQVLCIQSMPGSMYTEYARLYAYRVCQVLYIQSMPDNCNVNTDGTITSTKIDKTTNTAIGLTATEGYSHLTIKDSSPQPVDKIMCPCPCQRMGRNMSVSELDEVVAKTKHELRIDKKKISSYKRSKISQTDIRTSSMFIGIVGGIVISIPILSIIICDVVNM